MSMCTLNKEKQLKNTGRKVAVYGVLVATALILSYLESLIPAFFAVPGMKLGLTNLVVLVALYLINWQSAAVINVVRVILVGILFGNIYSLAYSLAGALLSGIGMILLKKSGLFKMVTVSIAGGVLHNIGQILVAVLVLHTVSVAWYVLILWVSGIVAGAVIGIIGALLCRRLEKPVKKLLG